MSKSGGVSNSTKSKIEKTSAHTPFIDSDAKSSTGFGGRRPEGRRKRLGTRVGTTASGKETIPARSEERPGSYGS